MDHLLVNDFEKVFDPIFKFECWQKKLSEKDKNHPTGTNKVYLSFFLTFLTKTCSGACGSHPLHELHKTLQPWQISGSLSQPVPKGWHYGGVTGGISVQ